MAILMIVVTAMLSVFSVLQRTSVRHASREQAIGDVRFVLERMTKEARQLTAVRTGSGPAILDMDTYVNGTVKRITYTASGATLTRAVDGAAPVAVLSNLRSLSLFTYSPSVSAPTDLRVDIRVRPRLFSSDDATVALTSEVQLRNRG